MYRLGFVVEQVLGHVTHGQNLQEYVAQDSSVEAQWALPSWEGRGLDRFIPNWTVRAGWQARKGVGAIQRQAPLDALFFHTQVTAVLSPNWLSQIPSIVSLDATPLQYDKLGEHYNHSAGPAVFEQLKYKLVSRCFNLAQHIVTWSSWTKDSLVADYSVPAEKITVIPPGVNIQDWKNPASKPGSSEKVKILFVGGDFVRKGGTVFLEAFRKLQQSGLPVEAHIVTRSELPDEKNVFAYNGLKPNSVELKNLYFESDIFCLPTKADSFGIVFLEAQAAGLPVITTQQAAAPEIVKEGETGYLIRPDDVERLTEKLLLLIKDPALRCAMGDKAARIVAAEFNVQTNTQRLIDLLKLVADHGK